MSFGRPPNAALGCTRGRCEVLDGDEDAGAPPAGGCGDAFGVCTPRADTLGFHCVCEDGAVLHWDVAPRCECALFGCAPACSSGSGACYPRPDGFECRCADAGEATLVGFERGLLGCAASLEAACGPPPRGERCEQLVGGAIVACEADGSGGWQCDCAAAADAGPEPLAAPTAPDATGAGTFLCGGPGTFMVVDGRPLTCAAAIWTQCGGT